MRFKKYEYKLIYTDEPEAKIGIIDITGMYFEGLVGAENWLAGKKGEVNWKSRPNFGHTFDTHGEGNKNLKSLLDMARGTGNEQDQCLNNQKADEYLNSLGKVTKVTDIDIPNGLGQVITPSGEVISTTRARIVPSKDGKVKTAFPIKD